MNASPRCQRTPIVAWVVNPVKQSVQVFTPGQPVKKLGISDTLDGGAVLPGFTLALKDLFTPEA